MFPPWIFDSEERRTALKMAVLPASDGPIRRTVDLRVVLERFLNMKKTTPIPMKMVPFQQSKMTDLLQE